MKPILGKTSEYWVSIALGIGYKQFDSGTGVGGLAKEMEGDRLDILAIHSSQQGKGQLREFIRQCKESYSTICIWVVENPVLASALVRYGFTPETEIQNDETVEGFRWDKSHEHTARPGAPDKTIPDNIHHAGQTLCGDVEKVSGAKEAG